VANDVVPSHVYPLWGYFGSGANAVFVLPNPWGTHAVVNGQDGSMLFLTLDQMIYAGFNGWTEVNLQQTSTVVGVVNASATAGASLPSSQFGQQGGVVQEQHTERVSFLGDLVPVKTSSEYRAELPGSGNVSSKKSALTVILAAFPPIRTL